MLSTGLNSCSCQLLDRSARKVDLNSNNRQILHFNLDGAIALRAAGLGEILGNDTTEVLPRANRSGNGYLIRDNLTLSRIQRYLLNAKPEPGAHVFPWIILVEVNGAARLTG